MFKISIIIPMYNSESYIERCLDSILLDGCTDIEVICVNDGSTDSSLDICERRRKADSRLKIISQSNKGVAAARNEGLKAATGKWIFFVDSDDVVLPTYYESIINSNEIFDVIIFDGIWGNKKFNAREKKIVYYNYESRKLIGNLLMSKAISDISHTSLRSPCMKAYKRQFIEQNNILFPTKIKIGEDMLFNIAVFSLAKNVFYNPVDVYKEIDRVGSATHSYVPDMIQNDVLFQAELKSRLIQYNLYEEYQGLYYSEVKSGIMRCLRKQVFWNDKQPKYTRKEKIELIKAMHNEDVYKEAYMVRDNNLKRNFILFLYRYKLVYFLNKIFQYEKNMG